MAKKGRKPKLGTGVGRDPATLIAKGKGAKASARLPRSVSNRIRTLVLEIIDVVNTTSPQEVLRMDEAYPTSTALVRPVHELYHLVWHYLGKSACDGGESLRAKVVEAIWSVGFSQLNKEVAKAWDLPTRRSQVFSWLSNLYTR